MNSQLSPAGWFKRGNKILELIGIGICCEMMGLHLGCRQGDKLKKYCSYMKATVTIAARRTGVISGGVCFLLAIVVRCTAIHITGHLHFIQMRVHPVNKPVQAHKDHADQQYARYYFHALQTYNKSGRDFVKI
jgi:hypothetical protein